MKTYGEEWREQRKLVSFSRNNSMLPTFYHRHKEQESRRLVYSLLKKPNELFPQVKL